MGKRQIRIFKSDFTKHLEALPGKEANILLASQATLHGVILKADHTTLTLRDLRRREHTFSLQDVEEIMLDRETEY